MAIFVAKTIALFLITGCVGASDENKEKTQAEDTLTDNSIASTGQETVTTTELSCSIFFKTDDHENEETGEMIKGEVLEREEFRISKSYTWCYDVEGFHHLTISGKGKNLSLAVNAVSKTILKKDKFDLNGDLTLTSKEIKFIEGEKYSIVIKQEENVIFEGKIDSQGCM